MTQVDIIREVETTEKLETVEGTHDKLLALTEKVMKLRPEDRAAALMLMPVYMAGKAAGMAEARKTA